jgi:hypothetical protein
MMKKTLNPHSTYLKQWNYGALGVTSTKNREVEYFKFYLNSTMIGDL